MTVSISLPPPQTCVRASVISSGWRKEGPVIGAAAAGVACWSYLPCHNFTRSQARPHAHTHTHTRLGRHQTPTSTGGSDSLPFLSRSHFDTRLWFCGISASVTLREHFLVGGKPIPVFCSAHHCPVADAFFLLLSLICLEGWRPVRLIGLLCGTRLSCFLQGKRGVSE